MEAEILKAVERAATNGELACVDAHAIAAQLGVSPFEVGEVVNQRTAIRFHRCQLGLFGYGSKAEGRSKIVLKATHVPAEIEAALRARAVNGRIACREVWDIADQFRYPRLGVANIIEALGLKVSACQLGSF